MKDTVLVIDNGTQSLRALIFDFQGNLLFKCQLPITDYYSLEAGWSEINPGHLWELVGTACKRLWRQGAAPQAVRAIAVTAQRGTLITLGSRGEVIRNSITWMDERLEANNKPLPFALRTAFFCAGVSQSINKIREEAKVNWLAQNEPESWKQTQKVLQVSGFLNYRLTGLYKDSVASQVGYVPFDYKNKRWANSSHFLWKLFDVKASQLPELVQPGESIGPLNEEAASHLGLAPDLPVIAAASDKACEVVGSGAIDPTVACISYGTRATINIHSKTYFEIERPLPAYPAGVPDMFTPEASVILGYWMVNWFKNEFGHPEILRSQEMDTPTEAFFDELLEKTPPGSNGLVLYPKWGKDNGQNKNNKGAIIGFGEYHTRGHFYRSIIEGIAYELKYGLRKIERKSRMPVKTLRVSGGGSQSDAIMQITADIFGVTTERPHTFETAGLGAAISASVGIGVHNDFPSAMECMTRQTDIFTPDPETKELYKQLYNDVFRKIPGRLAPLNSALQSILPY
ncbi:FGGY-family carbohydrate kinase [Flexibacterium corallicola]|uniref:FGGY-family carbohydrate kinase n=1 Tax=Flexibacterium corallicola TaxID=3037259 RepID=UPI00286ECD57|nr:FGGY-family carbohydrate kinase [Pseudovibrio sp. M1P-2-3]